ncbi:hypothetical protein GNY06_12375 [Elizabethkingia argentiflava]|uniref:Putative beta-lactamase-inhibitor-like PepSY-like domain-containing protein n=1 Tax=Elizabethkingia argenteiflava TaxID=2681556 RepID=A0A845PXZ9_9FLAO|nr:PepSY-like domain-containing protein [Elizabethkingia argenteiflava]NAW52133.1 hypothetical protein [Elizabethkingia argenteiflava]
MRIIHLKKSLIALALMAINLMIAQKQSIPKSQLPSSAQSFLNQHINGRPFIYIKNAENPNDINYTVKYNNGVEITFQSDGGWKEISAKETQMPTSFIPPAMISYINTHYPEDVMIKIMQTPDRYDITLKSNRNLRFDRQGKFLK